MTAYVAYAPGMYVLSSTILCLIYSCIECTKDKGKLDTSSQFMLLSWCIISLFVASAVAGVSGQMMAGTTNILYLLLVTLLACATLSVSSLMIYWVLN